jgi:S1-C subfamily serine protease
MRHFCLTILLILSALSLPSYAATWGQYEYLKEHIQNAQAAVVKKCSGTRCTSSAVMINEKFAFTAAHSALDGNWEVEPNLNVKNIFGEIRNVINVWHTGSSEADNGGDFAVMELESPFNNSYSVKIASETADKGSEIFGVGHPVAGYDWAVTFGKAKSKLIDNGINVEHQLYVTPGFSGGGVFNTEGELITVMAGGGEAGSRAADGTVAPRFSEDFEVINHYLYPSEVNAETHLVGPSFATINNLLDENNIPESVLVAGGNHLPDDPMIDPLTISDTGFVPDEIVAKVADVSKISRHSTVAMTHSHNDANAEFLLSNATGVIIAEDLILTAGHVVDEEYINSMNIMFADGTVYKDNLEVAFKWEKTDSGDIDLALIKINGPLPKSAVIAKLASNSLQKGDYGYFVGNPAMLWASQGGWRVTAGKYKSDGESATVFDPNFQATEFMLGAQSIGGYSGSGTYNLDGAVVGIVSGGGCFADKRLAPEFFNIQDPHETSYSPINGNCRTVSTDLDEIRKFLTENGYSRVIPKPITIVPEVPQQSLAKIIRSDGSETNSAISIGSSSDNGETYSTSFTVDDEVILTAKIYPDSNDVGEEGELYVVIRTVENGKKIFKALNEDGAWEVWNASLKSLPAAKYVESLESVEEIEIYSGSMTAGQRLIYVGYSLFTDGKPVITTSLSPLKIDVSE